MKIILYYGDSNTWGYDARTRGRFPPGEQCMAILAREPGDDYTVIPEGLNGLTAIRPDPAEGEYKTSSVIASDPTDGIHLAPGQHRKLGQAVAAEMRRILG